MMVIKGILISVGEREDFKSHLLLWCTFRQDITFCCLEVYISFLELHLEIGDPAASYLREIELDIPSSMMD